MQRLHREKQRCDQMSLRDPLQARLATPTFKNQPRTPQTTPPQTTHYDPNPTTRIDHRNENETATATTSFTIGRTKTERHNTQYVRNHSNTQTEPRRRICTDRTIKPRAGIWQCVDSESESEYSDANWKSDGNMDLHRRHANKSQTDEPRQTTTHTTTTNDP